jgi:Zn-finger nucleic acid-binding protein
MDCPLCKVNLQLADRQGVAIDYCPQCRGIWLDRGELEKLLELSLAQAHSSTALNATQRREDDYRTDHYAERRDLSRDKYGRPKKKESWLGKLFDFD